MNQNMLSHLDIWLTSDIEVNAEKKKMLNNKNNEQCKNDNNYKINDKECCNHDAT